VVSYFRWRQAPFAQEQMHAGLLRPDDTKAAAWPEVEAVARDLDKLGLDKLDPAAVSQGRARVALVVDVEAQWLGEIERQGRSYDYTAILLEYYQALRGLGLDVDFIAPDGDPAGYALILAPAVAMPKAGLAERLSANGAVVLFGPRSGAKTKDVTLPEGLAPGPLRSALPIRVLSVETLRPGCEGRIRWNGRTYASGRWREEIEVGEGLSILGRYEDDTPALVRKGRVLYLATLTDGAFLIDLFEDLAQAADLAPVRLPEGLRLRRRGDLVFALNYSDRSQTAPAPEGADFVLGGPVVGARDVSVWRHPA
jgi:beta-galactosidase